MSPRRTLISLALVLVAVLLQTTVFAPGNIQPLGAAPNLVLLVVIACVRYVAPEVAVLLGFTAGLLIDLLSSSPLGLWAMTMTAVAYVALRLRDRAADGPMMVAIGVFGLTLLGQLLFAVAGTLFGLRTISDPSILKKLILPAVYNLILAAPVMWGVRVLLRPPAKSWAL